MRWLDIGAARIDDLRLIAGMCASPDQARLAVIQDGVDVADRIVALGDLAGLLAE